MGFIISESGFEMTPGSKEVDTPGIWRQDETMSTVGDAFTSAFAAGVEGVEPRSEEQRKERLKRREARIDTRIARVQGKTYNPNLHNINAITKRNKARETNLIAKKAKINKKIK